MTDLDEILQQCVQDIWYKFDRDNNGVLDKKETRNFVNLILGEN